MDDTWRHKVTTTPLNPILAIPGCGIGPMVSQHGELAWAHPFNHGAVIMAVNTGATGKELPDRLEKNAFGPEALRAYRKFLRGEPLKEKPVSADRTGARLQRKMEAFQARLREWQAAGRDPSPIVRMVEGRLPPLIQSGRFAEALALIDRALKQLDAKDGGTGSGRPSPGPW